MSEEKKKISFGFSKLVKKPNVIPAAPKPAETVEFIKCVEDNNIQVLNEVIKEEENELVIPMKPSSRSSDSKPKVTDSTNNTVPDSTKPESLDELAAKELVAEANRIEKEEEEASTFAVPLVSNPPTGEKESTLEDYESIPIEKYGLAMLRGMGWEPGKGIGKNAKIAPPVSQVLRPKGMGLGADKAVKGTKVVDSESKELKLCNGSCVRILSGSNKDSYGKVEGFIEESGRVIVKLARGGNTVIVGEFTVSVVTPEEYFKNSKVLNIAKYEEYKSNEKANEDSDEVPDRNSSSQYRSSKSSKSHRENGSSQSDNRYGSRNDRHSSRDDRHSSRDDRHSSRDERHSSRDDSERSSDRSSSRKDHESKRNSDYRSDRDSHHHRSSSKKHKRDRSPRRH
ncbi:unnamed protein product [Bemisia tabaci]|uniref:G-patch domain-containing protein n=1 Tax=Bemisia tabaci TaxID=7038 RepID=A0A9P0AIV5_BEMTA|nr:unnamed protein product [Bemisia tabaci]